MILIVESGSTKADWRLLKDDEIILSFQTKGWNPLVLTREDMKLRLEAYMQLKEFYTTINTVFFYCPGTGHTASVESMRAVMKTFFTNANLSIESDLLAAARAVYKNRPTFVSILGTGSNTAFYDGKEIEQWKPSLGYILADEGSGASLGKLLLRCMLYGDLPQELYADFIKNYSVSIENVLQSVYKEPLVNKYLASFVPFLHKHKSHVFIKELLKNEFRNYLSVHLKSNPLIGDYPIGFIGSVAFYFSEILSDLVVEFNSQEIQFVKSPIDQLVNYHICTE